MSAALERILYVEDEPDIRTVALTVLRTLGGFEVISCSSGREALAAAPSAGADLILLDVMMPGMDGPTTLASLREMPQTASTPVIFMTAKVQPAEVRNLKSLGALDVIAKPFDPMTLCDQILQLWRGHVDAAAAARPAGRDVELAPFREGFESHVPAMLAQIELLWSRLVHDRDAAALAPLHRALHSLAGSGRTFGFGELGEAARALELAVAPWLGQDLPARPALDALDPLVERLRSAAASGAKRGA